ncbi:TfuA-like protein [Pararhizobium sp. BT-229]|uniref:TfuA-like protein n=1 Tax=Pararhizobium sp. BT-229 TaxID=2986923 RepID=UPI0021F70232|nr:TfuA-like protein [Pararhizobium sp. BT-229]MCV9963204.1 TfuA-like protein [Pararhizobium sp. BT-229]
MKVVFVGPSLPDADHLCAGEISVRPPAIQGDIQSAIDGGATCIGLIDGGFEYQPPVWHKEILYGLSLGVRIFGSSSMGALRAVECEVFGMIGVGAVFEGFKSGRLIDDADVALLHGPRELAYPGLTLPLVNVVATLDALHDSGQLSPMQRDLLENHARNIFFKQRTWEKIVHNSGLDMALAPLLRSSLVDIKRLDAHLLLAAMREASSVRSREIPDWQLNRPFL